MRIKLNFIRMAEASGLVFKTKVKVIQKWPIVSFSYWIESDKGKVFIAEYFL